MIYKTSDFIKFDNAFAGKHGDFSGAEEAFSTEERLEFLEKYSAFLQKKYNEGKSRKAISDEEVKLAKRKISGEKLTPKIRKRTIYDKASVYLADALSPYEKLSLYGGAAVENGTVVFNDKPVPPTPSCMLKFEKRLEWIDFNVNIGKDYLSVAAMRGVKQKPLVTTVGKSLEFRSGIAEVARIQFYDNGEVYARVAKREYYHHDAIYLGDYFTDRANEFSVVFGDDSYSVIFNGNKTENISYSEDLPIDGLFITGGMYSVGKWTLTPLKAIVGGKPTTDFFKPKSKEESRIYVGEKELPYCLSSHKNADKRLIAEVMYDYPGGKAILHCDTLNPCGEVRVNGETVLINPDFTAVNADITKYLRKGENEITLTVNPRAPEVNYSWHRNKDPYVGWYLSNFYIDIVPETYAADLTVKTKSVKDSGVVAEIAFAANGGRRAELFLLKIYPERGEERSIGTVAVKNGYKGEFKLNVEPWSTDNPVLYSVRAELKDDCGNPIDDIVCETGFRTIEQKDGELLLNGKRIVLKGALLMQFLPPYKNIVKSHVCPTNEEIITELLQIKAMNGNTARLHMLGYGTNDKRFAEIADRLGVCLIWTTSLIDSLETVKWGNEWRQKDEYRNQMKEVINFPSIIMWEGSNEFHADKFNFDPMFDEFVSAVKAEDDTRLICPSSHVYYGGGLYGNEGFYFQDDGESDQDFNPIKSSFGWKDENVIRSAHNYAILLGYGGKWDSFRKQGWKSQPSLLNSKKHAYLMTEFAVIGRQDDGTEECKEYIKTDSYELGDETRALGTELTQKDWRISQAYQALCADRIIKLLLGRDIDGMTWCCLSGGANDASYLKPPIDFYGYAKYAFYVMKSDFAPVICYFDDTDVKFGKGFTITPKISGAAKGKSYAVTVRVKSERGKTIDKKICDVVADGFNVTLEKWQPKVEENGFYEIEYSVEEV